MTCWSTQEERTLYHYVVSHYDHLNYVNWSGVQDCFPDRGVPECKTKYYRMLKQTCWDFNVSPSNSTEYSQSKRVIYASKAVKANL